MSNLVEEAKKLCHSNGRVHEDDITLLVNIISKLRDNPVIVQIGAGSCGAYAAAILGTNSNARFYSIDIHEDLDFQNWEQKFLEMNHYKGNNYIPANNASKAKKEEKIDIVIISPCPDHSVDTVKGMLKTWVPRLGNSGYLFVGSYDIYKEVSETCMAYFRRAEDMKQGWSALWVIGDAEKPKRKYNKRIKT